MISAIQVRDGVGGWRRGGDGRGRGEPCLRIPARRAPQQQQRLAHRDTWQRLAHRDTWQSYVRAVRRLHNNNRRADRGRERHLNDDDNNRHNNSVSARATCKLTAAAATTTGASATTGCAELRALLEAPLSRLGVYEEVISANISAISHIGEYSSQSRR